MKLGLMSAALPAFSLEKLAGWASDNGFGAGGELGYQRRVDRRCTLGEPESRVAADHR
ncbi:MAG: hypothetical protein U1B80_00345 [Anaerolineaceae bacterium]|nr:hypothetical protein [Anaerolineaceae bacterium]